MISADSITKLNTSVGYWTDSPEVSLMELSLLMSADPMGLSQFIDAPETRPSAEGLVLSSMRNQLALTITPNGLMFRDGSDETPGREDFPGRVAQVVEYIRGLTNRTYTVFGLSFDIEVKLIDEELPSNAILNRLVREDALKDTRYDVVGASAMLWYVAHDKMYELRVEPKGSQYNNPDYHVSLLIQMKLEGTMPSAEWLSQAMNEEYDDFKRVLAKVLTP